MSADKRISKLSVFLTSYLTLIFSLNLFFNKILFSPITFLLYILLLSVLIFKDITKDLTLTKILVMILIFISLSSPTGEWDARSIWMFHAKQIFYDQNIFAQFDNYGFQNEYPIFISYYAAQIARLFNYWNEILPKLSTILIAVPVIIYLSSHAKNRLHELIIIFLYTFFFGKGLINGEADALLGLYFTSIFSFIFFENNYFLNTKYNNRINIFFLISLIAIFINLKTNSLFLLFILVISVFIFKKIKIYNFCSIIFISIIPFLFFKFNVFNLGISGNFYNIFLKLNFLEIIFNFRELLIILNEIFVNKYTLITLIILLNYFFYMKKNFFRKKDYYIFSFDKSYNYILASIFIYICHVLFLVLVLMILSTYEKFDLVVWSLQRYMAPVLFFISYIFVYARFGDKLKKKNV